MAQITSALPPRLECLKADGLAHGTQLQLRQRFVYGPGVWDAVSKPAANSVNSVAPPAATAVLRGRAVCA